MWRRQEDKVEVRADRSEVKMGRWGWAQVRASRWSDSRQVGTGGGESHLGA